MMECWKGGKMGNEATVTLGLLRCIDGILELWNIGMMEMWIMEL
jgi:hypothetical protein